MISMMFAAAENGQQLQLPSIEYAALSPALLLIGGALFLLLASSLVRDGIPNGISTLLSTVVGFGAALLTFWLWRDLRMSDSAMGERSADLHSTIGAAIAVDHFALFFALLISVGFLLSVFLSHDWLDAHDISATEYYTLMMIASAGAMFMAAANDLMVVFVALEILSLSLYVLVGFHRSDTASREAALKYFLLGGFSSAVMLFGIAMVYGAIGSTNLANISAFFEANSLLDSSLFLFGIMLTMVGFAFKVAAVPFHQWAPDVYQGAPSPVTGYMASVVKAAAFAAMIRVALVAFGTYVHDWNVIVLAFALLSLSVGAVAACKQRNVKRMLAYSSISHAGFMLLGVYVATSSGIASVLYYLLAYLFMIVGTFAVVALVAPRYDSAISLDDFRGLAEREPAIAGFFAVLMFAQLGIPLTTGFLAKFYVIAALIEAHGYWIAVFALLASVIAAFAYLRITFVMFTRQTPREVVAGSIATDDGASVSLPQASAENQIMHWGTLSIVVISVFVTLLFGILPTGDIPIDLMRFARDAAADFFLAMGAS